MVRDAHPTRAPGYPTYPRLILCLGIETVQVTASTLHVHLGWLSLAEAQSKGLSCISCLTFINTESITSLGRQQLEVPILI